MPNIPRSCSKNEMLKFLQLNLNHCIAAQDLLQQTARERHIDVAILSEPHHCMTSCPRTWVTDSSGKAALWICGSPTNVFANIKAFNGFVRARYGNLWIYSCYLAPSMQLNEFTSALEELAEDARGRKVIIAGDFNAWAMEWGSQSTNARGHTLLEIFATLDVALLNTGQEYTFSRAGYGSVIDITFVSPSLFRDARWSLCDSYTGSDHSALLFTIGEPSGRAPTVWREAYRLDTFNPIAFSEAIQSLNTSGNAEDRACQMVTQVQSACNASMQRRKQFTRHQAPMYWWTEEICQLRTECIHARRSYQRARGRSNFIAKQQAYQVARRQLKKAIRTSKREYFLDLCDSAELDPWGRAYKTVVKRLYAGKQVQPTDRLELKSIVETLFPDRRSSIHESHSAPARQDAIIGDIAEVTDDEIAAIARKLRPNSAPGPDGIPNRALKLALALHPGAFTELFNACLTQLTFPASWKAQNLVLLPKADKPPEEPSSYRPICLLDTLGKVFEKLICNRLESAIVGAGGLSPNQFGFRKAMSTTDALSKVVGLATSAIQGSRWKHGSKQYCIIATLDVKNAFNTASWDMILDALAQYNIPKYLIETIRSYFRGRTLMYNTSEGVQTHIVSAGVPQGSVLGPLLWNLMYDGVLRLELPAGAHSIGFADDVAVVAIGKELKDTEDMCSAGISRIRDWLTGAGLDLAAHKTEAVLVSSRKIVETAYIKIGDITIASKRAIKYLGVMLDTRLTFREHLDYVHKKAADSCRALSRIMLNTRGPKQQRRLLLMSVMRSVILYAAPIWSRAMATPSYSRGVRATYRLSAIRVSCSFRTVSDDAALVIAGMLPLEDLVAEVVERSTRHPARGFRNATRTSSTERWQRRWNISTKGRWTHTLIPELEPWFNRKHGEINFYLSQILSGHGCFRSYLKRFGHEESDECTWCGRGMVEDAKHVFFDCGRFQEERSCLEASVGRSIGVDTLVDTMLESEGAWNLISSFAASVMVELRRLERSRRQAVQV